MQYVNLSTIYDAMIDVNYDEWISFLEEYFKDQGLSLKGMQLLELGCGTGNMTLKLKARGMEITALDISEDMLTVAQEKALKQRQKIHFLNMDMVAFQVNKKFDMVASFCDGYNYIIDETELNSGFKKVYSALQADGYFIFDISTEYKLREVIGNNTYTYNEEEVCYIWENNFEDDCLEMTITFFVKEGKLYKRIDEFHKQCAHTTETIWKNLIDAGFKSVEVYDNYSMNPLRDDSIRATFIARK